MAKFELCIDFVLKHEGGLLNDKATGEYSNFGITRELLQGINYFTKDPKELTINDAKNIYMQQFWQKYRLDLFTSDKVARKIMDMFVNMGPKQATLLIQRSLKLPAELIDGVLGHFTRGEINEMSESQFLQGLVEESKKYYTKIAVGPKEKYLQGWLNRAQAV